LLGQVAAVRQLIAADPALLSARNMFGAGAVHAAHYGGQDAVLDALGDLGLATDGFLAAELGRVAQELLDAGAGPALTATAGPHRGQKPADTALAHGHLLLAARLDVPGPSASSPDE